MAGVSTYAIKPKNKAGLNNTQKQVNIVLRLQLTVVIDLQLTGR